MSTIIRWNIKQFDTCVYCSCLNGNLDNYYKKIFNCVVNRWSICLSVCFIFRTMISKSCLILSHQQKNINFSYRWKEYTRNPIQVSILNQSDLNGPLFSVLLQTTHIIIELFNFKMMYRTINNDDDRTKLRSNFVSSYYKSIYCKLKNSFKTLVLIFKFSVHWSLFKTFFVT